MVGKRLSFEIGLLLCAKLAALTILYFAFFSSSSQPPQDSHAVASHLMSR